jgi:hypothetical protein
VFVIDIVHQALVINIRAPGAPSQARPSSTPSRLHAFIPPLPPAWQIIILSYQHACEGDSAALTHAFDVVSAHTLIAAFVIWILHEARTLSRAGCAGDQSAAQVHSVVPRLVYGRC